jgi:hypothetical protein
MRRLFFAVAFVLAGWTGGASARPRPSVWGTQDRSSFLNSLLDKPVDRPWQVTLAGNGTLKTFTLDDLAAIHARISIPF